MLFFPASLTLSAFFPFGGLSFTQASNGVAKPETTKPSLATLAFFTMKCVLNSRCSVPVCRMWSFPMKDFHVMQQLQQRGSASDVQASSTPVRSLLRPDVGLHGKEKHNKLQSRPTEEFPQPLPLWGQIIINHRLNNSAASEWMPFSAHFSAPASGGVPSACMYACRLGLGVCVVEALLQCQ